MVDVDDHMGFRSFLVCYISKCHEYGRVFQPGGNDGGNKHFDGRNALLESESYH